MPGTAKSKIELLIESKVREALRDLDRTEKEIDDLGKTGKKVNSTFSGLTKTLGGFVAALGIREVSRFAIEVTELVGRAQDLRKSLDNLAAKEGVNTIKLMEDLRKATSGTVSEVELMSQATQAKFLGIDLKNLPILFEFARRRAQDTGKDINFLVESIVTGLGRNSKLVLDNLGGEMLRLDEVIEEIAKDTGTWTGQVDDNLRKLHLQEAAVKIAKEAIEESGEASESAATKIARMNAQWENFKLVMGAILTGPAAAALDFINSALGKLGFNIDVILTKGLNRSLAFAQQDLKESQQRLKEVDQEIAEISEQIVERQRELGQPGFNLRGFFKSVTEQILDLEDARKELLKERETILSDIQIFQQDIDALLKEIGKGAESDIPIPKAGPSDEEIKRQQRIAQVIAQLRLRELVAGAKNELQARLLTLDQQYQMELRALGELLEIKGAHALEAGELERKIEEQNFEALKQLRITHEAELERTRQELIDENAAELRKREDEMAEAILEQEKEALAERRENYIQTFQEVGAIVEGLAVGLASDLADAATTGGEAWRNFFENLKRQIVAFLASAVVRKFLNFLARGFAPPGIGDIGNIFGSIFGAQHGALIKGSPGGQIVRVGENDTDELIIPLEKLRIPALPSPAPLAAGAMAGGSGRVNFSTLPLDINVKGQIVGIFPDHRQQVEFFQRVNREINIPDSDRANQFNRTKNSEFD